MNCTFKFLNQVTGVVQKRMWVYTTIISIWSKTPYKSKLPTVTLIMLVQSLVLSHFNYSAVLFVIFNVKSVERKRF